MSQSVKINVLGEDWEFVFVDHEPFSIPAEIWWDTKTVSVDNKVLGALSILTHVLKENVTKLYVVESECQMTGDTLSAVATFVANYAEDILADVNKIIMEAGQWK